MRSRNHAGTAYQDDEANRRFGISTQKKDIKEFEKEQKDRDLKQDAEIHFIRENYVRKEDMYRELGDWKTEINRLEDRINKNQQENQKLLLELTD